MTSDKGTRIEITGLTWTYRGEQENLADLKTMRGVMVSGTEGKIEFHLQESFHKGALRRFVPPC